MIRLVIYDDNASRRESLQALIALSDGLAYAGSFENCSNILQDIELAKPDIVLMDIEMPLVDGIEGLRVLKKNYPSVKVIMQTVFEDADKVFGALQAGAEGYILKSASVNQIIQSIQDVVNGGAVMSPAVALKVMNYFTNQTSTADYGLTSKEKEILRLLTTGLSYKMIADNLSISFFTVNNHIKKIYEKLQVHSLGEAVALAHNKKIV